MEMILSIIVPVYNVERYLGRCLESLLRQDLMPDTYEIILVDDGSTDGSGLLCDEAARKEGNVRVIHQSNQGLSAARNTGTLAAQGTYVLFVDSDDWIEDYVLKTLVGRMEKDALDVLRFRYRRVDEEGRPADWSSAPEHSILTGTSFLVSRLWFSCYAWQFMLRRSLLAEHHLLFKPGILFEDTEWTPRMLQCAGRVSDADVPVYDYFIRSGSITNGSARKIIEAQLSLVDDLQSQMRTCEDRRWYEGMISQLVVTMMTSLATSLYADRDGYLKQLKAKEVYPLSSFLANKRAKRKIRLINLSPRLACRLIHLANR